MKKKKVILLLIVLILVLAIGVLEYFSGVVENPLKSNKDKIEVVIDEGESFYSLLDNLSSKGMLKNKEIIKLKLKLDNKTNINLIPGKYNNSRRV